MIKKSLVTTAFMLTAYQLWLWWAKPLGNHTLRGLHNMIFCDGNIIRAQRYLHEKHDQAIVFVGTSLTATMEEYLNEPDVSCLAMPGMSAVDGLRVIEAAGTRPRIIMIEVNLLQRGPSQDLFDELLQPELLKLHANFSATRHEYQPLNLLVPRLDAWRRGETLQPPRVTAAHLLPQGHKHSENSNRGRLDGLEEDVEDAIVRLPEVYAQTCRIGSKVGLYWLPEHRDVNRSPAVKRLLQATSAQFQVPVEVNPDDEMCTTDGQHLWGDDACDCAYRFLQYARKQSSGKEKSLE